MGFDVYELKHRIRLGIRNPEAKMTLGQIVEFLGEAMIWFKEQRTEKGESVPFEKAYAKFTFSGDRIVGKLHLTSDYALVLGDWTESVINAFSRLDTLDQLLAVDGGPEAAKGEVFRSLGVDKSGRLIRGAETEPQCAEVAVTEYGEAYLFYDVYWLVTSAVIDSLGQKSKPESLTEIVGFGKDFSYMIVNPCETLPIPPECVEKARRLTELYPDLPNDAGSNAVVIDLNTDGEFVVSKSFPPPILNRFEAPMLVCDLCNSKIVEKGCTVTADEFRATIEFGLRPTESMIRSNYPPDMPLEDAYNAWITSIMGKDTDFLLCGRCVADALKFLEVSPASHTDGVKVVTEYLYERRRQYEGCEVIAGFITLDALGEVLQEADPQCGLPGQLTGKPLSAAYAKYFQDNNLTIILTIRLLWLATQAGHNKSRQVATRILNQIQLDQASNATVREPVIYVEGNEEGWAVAICIDDRFWTDEWDE